MLPMRRPIRRMLALATTLSAITAAHAADPTSSGPTGVGVTLGLGLVPLSFDLPGIDLGVAAAGGGVPASLDGNVDGVGYAISLGAEVGELGGVPLFVEVTAAFADADGTNSLSRQLAGRGSFALGSGTSAGHTLALTTSSSATGATASATVNAIDPMGGTATVTQTTFSPPGANLTNNFAEGPTAGGGRAFTNVVTDGSPLAATAIGFAGDANGFLLGATGDLSGIRIDTTTTQEADYAEFETRLVGVVPLGGSGWVATPLVAPAYRYLHRKVDTHVDVLLPVNPVSNRRAALSLTTSDDLTAHYAGGSLGIGAVGPVPGDVILSLGANAGLLGMFADHEGSSSATVFGIDTTTIAFDPVTDELDQIAYFARASVGVTKQLGGFSLSVGGQAEYLSDVPTVRRDVGVALGAPGALTATGGSGSVRLDTDSAVILSGSLSVSLTF